MSIILVKYFWFSADRKTQINAAKEHVISVNDNKGQTISAKITPVQSDLRLPDGSVLLERPELIKMIESRVNANHQGDNTIGIVGLLGMGGVGKTTLARMWSRMYRQKHQNTSIWEINAETPDSLRYSFTNLATALAQHPKQKEELNSINQIQDPVNKERQRLSFVKNRLKEQPGWLLIFDNVESYATIKDYLPGDHTIWGKGYVLITTRNVHLQDAESIKVKNMIYLEELRPNEVLQLFCRIRFGCEPEKRSEIEQAQTRDFLKQIPPFPLDISVAAKYIGRYTLSPLEYLAALNKQDASFLDVQQQQLKDRGEYNMTRYDIIILSLQKIIESDKENIEKLLMLSMMGSQDVPKAMLSSTPQGVEAPEKADKFIREMMKHSLITMDTAAGDITTISMHRSTWEIMCAYLMNNLKFRPPHPCVRRAVQNVFNYVYTTIDDDNCSILKLLEPHTRKLSESVLLRTDEQMEVVGMMGCISFYAFKGKAAQELLEKSIKYIELNMARDQNLLARLYMHLGMTYSLNCNDTKAEEYLDKAQRAYAASNNVKGCIESICLLAHNYYVSGNFLKAKEVLNKTKALNCSDTETKGLMLRIASLIERDLGNIQAALKFINEAIAHRESTNKIDQLQAWNIIYKGLVYRDMGDYVTADTWAEKGDVLHSQYNATSKMYACVKFYRSGIYRLMGNYAEAEMCLKAALSICERESIESPLETGFGKTLIAKVYRNTGHLDKAFIEAKKAETLYIELFGGNNLRTSWIRMTLGQIYNDQGKYSEARDLFQECLNVHRTMLKDTHPKIGKILSELGYAQVKLGDIKQGHTNLENGLKNYEEHYGKDHMRTAYVLRLISESLQAQGDLTGAEEAALSAYAICQKANHPDQIVSLKRLGDVRIYTGNAQGNLDLKNALNMAETTFGKDSPLVTQLKAKL